LFQSFSLTLCKWATTIWLDRIPMNLLCKQGLKVGLVYTASCCANNHFLIWNDQQSLQLDSGGS
jgi:hypothetical protein